jgi:hypothetical protein
VRCYAKEECELWLEKRHRALPTEAGYRLEYGAEIHRLAYVSTWIADHLPYKQSVLLWMTEWGVWPSSENWHLYHLLRKSHGEHRLLEEAPGHLFFGHEAADLTSMLQIAMMNGWGGYVLTEADHVNAFFSHDEYVDFYANNPASLNGVRDALK